MRGAWLVLVAACGEAPEGEPAPVVPGEPREVLRVPTRRLTRAEYDRTVHDLLGVDVAPGRSFPVDDASDGFDVVAEALTVSPLLVELWERAAGLVVAEALRAPVLEPLDLRLEAEGDDVVTTALYEGIRDGARALYSGGDLVGRFSVPLTGTYRLTLAAWGDQGGDEPVRVTLRVAFHGTGVELEVPGTALTDVGAIEVDLPAGAHEVVVTFVNDAWDEATGLDRNLYVDAVRVEGPLDFVPAPNPARDSLLTCDPDAAADPGACIRTILARVVPRAWRRPVDDAELDALAGLADAVIAAGDPPLWGLEFALRATLTSPHFTFLVEPEAEGPVDDHVLASRLSYLLWSSLPDERLTELAASGALHDPDVLRAEVARLIADPRADAFVEDFAGQWLMVRALDGAQPDFWTFPGFTERTRASMQGSMRAFFADLLRNGRPLTDLVDSPWMFVDREMRLLLGIPRTGDPEPDAFVRVDAGGMGRRGWLTQPGLLTATSYPTRTSPVRRGVWVLSQLLCDEPPPPPAGVESFPEPSDALVTVRDRLEAHRTNPACAGCHDAIDPVGLAFEHFDGIGRWRDVDAGRPVDASGELPDGTAIDGVEDLAAALARDDRLTACVVEKVFTYAHRRAPTSEDEPFLHAAEAEALAAGGTLADVITALVLSPTFRRPGVPAVPGEAP